MRCENTTSETRFVSVLDVGISGTVAIINVAEPDGTTLAAKETYEVGRTAGGALEGIDVYWPPSVPGDEPRPETMITIVADAKVAGLGRLEQGGVVAKSVRARRGRPWSSWSRTSASAAATPGPRPPRRSRLATGCTGSTSSAIGRRARARPTSPPSRSRSGPIRRSASSCRGPPAPPKRVAVRLKELTVHSNRSVLAAAVRVDALVVTAPSKKSDKPYRADDRSVRPGEGRRPAAVRRHARVRGAGRTVPRPRGVGGQGRPPRPRPRRPPAPTRCSPRTAQGALVTLAGLAVAAPPAAVVAGSAAAVGGARAHRRSRARQGAGEEHRRVPHLAAPPRALRRRRGEGPGAAPPGRGAAARPRTCRSRSR